MTQEVAGVSTPVDAPTNAWRWLDEVESLAQRLTQDVKDAELFLGPSLPLTELEQSVQALRAKLAEGRDALAGSAAPAVQKEAPASPSDRQALDAVLSREEQGHRLAGRLEADIGQPLANAVVELEYAASLIESDPQAVQKGMAHLKAELQTSLERLRWLVSDLRPPALLSEMGLGPALSRYAQRFGAYAGVTVEAARLAGFVVRLPASTELAVFRTVQVALELTRRRRGAQRIEIDVAPCAGGWAFSISDDGEKLDINESYARMGLADIYYRMRGVGGRVEVSTQDGAGTRVTIWVPQAVG